MLIPQEVFDLYYQTVDDFTDSNFGVSCILTYPEKRVDCENCIFDVMLGKSSNVYQSGGPIAFDTGLCPYCNGEGYRSSVQTETIKLRVYYDRKSWLKLPIPANLPDGSIAAYGHMSDLPKILKATEMQVHADIAGQGTFIYTLFGEPTPHGFKKNKYILSWWARK